MISLAPVFLLSACAKPAPLPSIADPAPLPSVAELEAFASEEERRRTLPHDCLAGACLGESVSGDPQPEVVEVAGSPMLRTLTICRGQIVGVLLYQAWVLSTPTVPYVLFDHGHFLEGEKRVESLARKMLNLGWSLEKVWDETESTGERSRDLRSAQRFVHPEKQGVRGIGKTSIETARYGYPQKWETQSVGLHLWTTHPNRKTLCRGDEGL